MPPTRGGFGRTRHLHDEFFAHPHNSADSEKAQAMNQITSAPPLRPKPAPTAIDSPQVQALHLQEGEPPLFLEARPDAFLGLDEAIAWARAHRSEINDLVLRYGAVVLRNFPTSTAEDFSRFLQIFPTYLRGYRGGAGTRAKLAPGVMEATQLAADLRILMHSEMAYATQYPPRLAFFCRKPAEAGGETPIADMRKFMRLLPRELDAYLEANGSRVVRNCAPAGSPEARVEDHIDNRGWDQAFETDDRTEVESICRDLGTQPIWHDDGSLTLVTDMDVFTTHPMTGERFYRSYIHTQAAFEGAERRELTEALRSKQKMPSQQLTRKGEPFPAERAAQINALFDAATVAWPWQAGDIMILDNLAVAHGRAPYRGEREVQVGMLDW